MKKINNKQNKASSFPITKWTTNKFKEINNFEESNKSRDEER